MEAFLAEVGKFLITQGWLGLLIAFLGWIIYDQKRALATKDEAIKQLTQANHDVQEKRVQDARSDTNTMVDAVRGTKQSVDILTEVVRQRQH